MQDDEVQRIFRISTSKNPPSCRANSYGTPTGLHAAAEKIGDGAPLGMVFKGRVATGRPFAAYPPQEQRHNLITTRIIRLRGLQPGFNSGEDCDSFQRYIYIHGTNHEDRIGQPFSGGCIEMRNTEIIELFDTSSEGDLVWICA